MYLKYWVRSKRAWKKIRHFSILTIIVAVLIIAGTLVRDFVLDQVKNKIQSSFAYSRLYLSVFPPSLVIENPRSVSASPFFSAKKVSIRITLRSLLSRQKTFMVVVDRPVLRIYESAGKETGGWGPEMTLALPLIMEKGLIRDGELYYWGKETRIHSQGIDAMFSQRGDRFSLRSEISENDLNIGVLRRPLHGKISLALEGIGDDIHVRHARIAGTEGIVKAKGVIRDPFNPEMELETTYNLQSPMVAGLLELPFEWKGRVSGSGTLSRKAGAFSFSGGFSSRTIILSAVPMGDIEGTVDYQHPQGGTVELNVRKNRDQVEYLKIDFDQKRLDAIARDVDLLPLANFIELPWPVTSHAWGNFTVMDEKLTADVEFREEPVQVEPDRYPFRGNVHVTWDGIDDVTFSSEDMESSFARMSMSGRIKVEKTINLSLDGDVKDGKLAREFTARILKKVFDFPEIRGRGQAKVDIFGDFFFPQVKAEFSLSPGGFDRLDAAFVKGEAELFKEDFFARFEVRDPRFQGRIGLFTNLEQTTTNIWVDQGRVEAILPAFQIDLPFVGEASGYFEYREKNKIPQYQGNFTGKEIDFLGQKLTDVTGKLEGDLDTIHFPEFQFDYLGGIVNGRAFLKPLAKEFDVDAEGQGIDLSMISPKLSGIGSVRLKGKGLLGQDRITGDIRIEDFLLLPFQPAEISADVALDYSPEAVTLGLKGLVLPGESEFDVSLAIPFESSQLNGEIRGFFSNMDLFLPWQGAQARINYHSDIMGSFQAPVIKGVMDIQGSVLPFPRFAHAFRDFSGLVSFENEDFSLRSFHGKFGGGDVIGSGTFRVGKEDVEMIDLEVEGENMTLALLERTRMLARGKARLIKNQERFVWDGDFTIERLQWQRELTEKFSFSSAVYQSARKEPGFFDDLNLNIRLRAEDNAWVENSLGRLKGRFDLTVTGNIWNPVILGDIEVLDGNVDFQDRDFKVLRGQISFFNPAVIEPYVQFEGETYVKDYRVTSLIEGLWPRVNIEFNSSPPLPPEDVMALLALGEAFRRTYHYDRSTGQSTASLLSFTLSEEAKKRAENLFGIDRFRIDPFIMGSTADMTARLTLGKKLSRNFFILYSTNLSTQREEITRIEWEISSDFTIVAIRDESGRLSIDVKVHKRF